MVSTTTTSTGTTGTQGLANKTVLITGANGGVGFEVTRHLLQKGHRKIACHFRSTSDKLAALLRDFDLNPEAHTFQASLENETEVKSIRAAIETQLGPVDAVVNVAGASTNGMLWKLSLEDFRKIMDANLTTAFLTSREFVPGMRERSWGRIINFSSIVGSTGVAGASHYCAAKAALMGFTKAAALELANKKVTVNAIALGYFDYGLIRDVPEAMQKTLKERIPLGRFGQGQDVGGLVHYLLSPEADFMTGQILHLNGGQF